MPTFVPGSVVVWFPASVSSLTDLTWFEGKKERWLFSFVLYSVFQTLLTHLLFLLFPPDVSLNAVLGFQRTSFFCECSAPSAGGRLWESWLTAFQGELVFVFLLLMSQTMRENIRRQNFSTLLLMWTVCVHDLRTVAQYYISTDL